VTQPVDSSILHEIVRVIESRRKVPEKVIVKSREYVLTYLEDHQRRLEEALQRYDSDRLNMLYGQLASKIKYQLLRRLPARAAEAVGLAPAKRPAAKPPAARKAAKPPAARKAAKPSAARKAAKPPAKAKPAAKAKKVTRAARKPATKRPAGKGNKPTARKRR
jgi:hypothetical protein